MVFGNPLLVKLICSFMDSKEELLNFRLVNHICQEQATKRLQAYSSIVLNEDSRVEEFLELMRLRREFGLQPWPFTRFELDLSLSTGTLQNFGQAFGSNIERCLVISDMNGSEDPGKLVIILSHTPNLREFTINCHREPYLTDEEFNCLPSSFTRLITLGLKLNPSNRFIYISISTTSHPLFDLLIGRAPLLRKLKISGRMKKTSISRILKFLTQSRPHNLPTFAFGGWLNISRTEISFLQDMVDWSGRFTQLKIFVNDNEDDADDVEDIRMLQLLGAFLEKQTLCLSTLKIGRINCSQSIQLPSLLTLKYLHITYPDKDDMGSQLNWRPILSPNGNPFPGLANIVMEYYHSDVGILATSLPSVQSIQILYPRSSLSDPSWKFGFSNLTTLRICFQPKKESFLRQTLRFILTHLTLLVKLKIDFLTSGEFALATDCDYWDLLTGEAPRFLNNSELLSDDVFVYLPPVEPEEENVNGIYSIPSLSNMRVLKEFSMFPRLLSNLNAIWYMSRTGQLRPLEELEIKLIESFDENLPETQVKEVMEELDEFHGRVTLISSDVEPL